MTEQKIYLAIDLGAGSGRVVAGVYDGHALCLEEVHRFSNTPEQREGHDFWQIKTLFQEIKIGLGKAVQTYGGESIVSAGVDAWGVDYGLLDAEDQLIEGVFQYRDPRTEGMMEAAGAQISQEEIYDETGIQFLSFNSVYQLFSQVRQKPEVLEKAASLLFVPDLITFWLTGVKIQERTIASTSQMLNPKTGEWSKPILEKLQIPARLFTKITEAGDSVGPVLPAVGEEIGCPSLKIVAVGGHDTASAVAGIPLPTDETNAFLSSGTWSLMGCECPEPVITPESRKAGLSNEVGVYGTIRLLKNVSGMWFIQECRRAWEAEGKTLDFAQLAQMAADAPPFAALIDPDWPEFLTAGDMPAKVARFCKETGQTPPQTKGGILRACLESLALKYRLIMDQLEEVAGQPLDGMNIIGGGSQHGLLNQLSANALGKPITAGPVEATSLGSVLIQMVAAGDLDSIQAGRELVRHSFPTKRFLPEENSHALWEQKRVEFQALTRRS